MKQDIILFITIAMLVPSVSFAMGAQDQDQEVAYVEEITTMPDGSQLTRRFRPGDKPLQVKVEEPVAPPEPRQRGLNSVEKLELDRLENDFEHGRITATEYYLRRNQILRSTYVDAPPDDNVLEQSVRF